MSITRRNFLTRLGTSTLDFLIPEAHAASAGSHTLVCIFLRGAMDGLNAVVPYGDSFYYDKRPELSIGPPGAGADTAIDLNGFFGLNPAMAPVKPIYDSGDLAIIHATGAPFTARSHFQAQLEMEHGYAGSGNNANGWLARHFLSRPRPEFNDFPFRAIAVGNALPESLRGARSASALANVTGYDLVPDSNLDFQGLLQSLYAGQDNQLSQQAVKTFQALQALDYFNPALYTAEDGIFYPKTGLGRSLLQTAQYIKSGMNSEVFCLNMGGWDHHDNLKPRISGKLSELGEALGIFYADMGERMNNITVLVMSEFGRRVAENASAGADHGYGGVMFAMGRKVNGGRVYADWPGLADHQLRDGDLEITTDYRNVIGELLFKLMGNTAIDTVFSDYDASREWGIFS